MPPSPTERPQAESSERAVKRSRICSLLEPGDEAVWLTSPAAVSWYLCGARVHTSLQGPPIAAVLVGPETELVVTFTNEAERLAAEELDDDVELTAVPWDSPLDSVLAGRGRIRGEDEYADQLRTARAALLPAEQQRFRRLGEDSARALTAVLSGFRPQMSERQLAAEVAAAIVAAGADPLVVMVSGTARAQYRHPLPTEQPVGERAMVVVCARRHGLIANLTRWVRAGEPDARQADAQRRIMQVEAAFFDATVEGRRLAEVLDDGAAAYARHGFSRDEWRNHHQGGAAGYAGRDPRASSGVEDLVQQNQAFAWNPSAPGVKVEDTMLLRGGQLEPLTVDPDWPTVEVAGRRRPDTLVV